MSSKFFIRNSTFLILLLISPSLLAWGEKGHYLANEAATIGLPADMPHFFLRSFSDLVWLGYEPDRWRNAGESLEEAADPEHFLDYEFAAGLDLPRGRYEFLELMQESGRLRRFGIDNDTVGFAPWRIAELSELLANQFRRWRFARDPGERSILEREIIRTAGILGHYVADSANPHHTTIHYNGWAAAENPHRFATDCGTHSRFESAFVSHAVDLDHVTAKLRDPIAREDYFVTALDLIRSSNGLVTELYTLDRDGAFDLFADDPRRGIAFASDRIAAGASVLRDLWWSAWVNSGQRPRRN
jgi:hypothetical protein